ncbi:MAG: hypothetical protein ABJL67_05625 [Sulfitobacter sp.]
MTAINMELKSPLGSKVGPIVFCLAFAVLVGVALFILSSDVPNWERASILSVLGIVAIAFKGALLFPFGHNPEYKQYVQKQRVLNWVTAKDD